MSPQKQRIAIATACGWTPCKKGCNGKTWRLPDDSGCVGNLPNYLNDKNAMHQAKKVLTDKGLMLEFVDKLIVIIGSANGLKLNKLTPDNELVLVANATAEQEAKSCLKTLGLWEEEK